MSSDHCTPKFIFTVLVVAIGSGFHNGYHTGICNVPSNMFKEWITSVKTKQLRGKSPSQKEVDAVWSTITGVFSLGGMLGALLTGFFSERLGRKKSLFWNNFIVLAAIGLLIWAKELKTFEIEAFMLGRFLAGINAGLNSGVSQIYLVEIAPDNVRGFVAGLYPFFTTFFMMLSQIIGLVLATEKYWQTMFLIALVPSCIQIICLIFCPESPKHLVIHDDREEEAERAVAFLRGSSNTVPFMRKIIEEDNIVKEMHAVTLKRLFTDIQFRTPLIICSVLNLGHQLSGINCHNYFSMENFQDIGIEVKTAGYVTICLIFTELVVIGIGILLIDRIGRRKLTLISFLGMAFTTVVLTITIIQGKKKNGEEEWDYTAVGFHFVFVAFFGIGAGIVPSFITAEMFSHSMRSIAVALTMSLDWFAGFLTTQTFLLLRDQIEYYIFAIFVILNVFFFFFSNMYMPETARLTSIQLIKLYSEELYD